MRAVWPEPSRDTRRGAGGIGAWGRWGVLLVALGLMFPWSAPEGTFPIRSASASDSAGASALIRGRQVYRAACAVCHGVNGDGDGTAAHMFRVGPRDFRQGVYKFRTTPLGSLPTDDDLFRTVTAGIRWTGMVGRPDLAEVDRRAVVQYLKSFSPRFAAEAPAPPVVVPPRPIQEPPRVEEGRRLYQELACVACHGPRGRGDGPAAQGLMDLWGRPTRPSDLTWRPLKRGGNPKDLYLTIVTGLSGTPMPYVGGGSLDHAQIWALVDFLDSLVPAEHRVAATQALGEEARGWMAVRMGGMMGGMMRSGMMRRMPRRP
jgi:mono/diheme cytochrome c family protein